MHCFPSVENLNAWRSSGSEFQLVKKKQEREAHGIEFPNPSINVKEAVGKPFTIFVFSCNGSFIFSILMRSSKPTPFMPFFFAFLTCFYNGILHGQYFTNYYQYDDGTWLMLPNFWIGFAMFLYGMKVNIGADSDLRKLRKVGETGYKIPTGGWFERITCPNYFGEIVEMWGYALASLAPPAIAHAFFTTIFLSKRALAHHDWYLKKFEDYPKDRKAIFPWVL